MCLVLSVTISLFSLAEQGRRLTVIFQEGIFITVESHVVNGHAELSATVAMTTSMQEHSQVEGLLGNFDGLRDNDLLPYGGGGAIDPDADDGTIFSWGSSCEWFVT